MSHKYDDLRIFLHDACMLKAIEDLKEFPSDAEIDKIHEISDDFKRRMAEMMAECFNCKNQDELVAARKRHLASLKKFAAAAAISVALTFSCSMSVEAIRDSLVKFVVRIYDDFLSFSIPAVEEHKSTIEKIYKLSWVPDGFKEKISGSSATNFYVQYQYENLVISYQQGVIGEFGDLIIDFTPENGETYEIPGYGTYAYANGVHQLVWNDGVYSFVLRTPTSKEDLLRMAQSVQPIATES